MVTPCKEDQELALICNCTCAESIAAMHAYQTSQHVATQLRSKLYCGLGMILILTAVMSGLPSSQHTQDLTELCSSKYDEDPVMWAIITRTPDESRCVETLAEGRFLCNTTSRQHTTCSEEQLGKMKYKSQLLPIIAEIPLNHRREGVGSSGKYLDSRGYSYR